MREAPFTAAELAARLGRSTDWLYRHFDRLVIEDRMPLPLSSIGRRRWDRATIEAWLGRHHPLAPAAPPANDNAGRPAGDQDWRAYLAQAYGRIEG